MNHFETSVVIESPIGLLELVAFGVGLTEIRFPHQISRPDRGVARGVLKEARAQLDEYFAGRREMFDLNLIPIGTEFQKQVWQELRRIPFGQTVSYLDIAQRLGRPKSCRAVGAANGRNPLPIVVPCHRVIGKSGALTGFAGGLETKAWLLEHESRKSRLFQPEPLAVARSL